MAIDAEVLAAAVALGGAGTACGDAFAAIAELPLGTFEPAAATMRTSRQSISAVTATSLESGRTARGAFSSPADLALTTGEPASAAVERIRFEIATGATAAFETFRAMVRAKPLMTDLVRSAFDSASPAMEGGSVDVDADSIASEV